MFKVEKLSDDNFQAWKQEMTLILSYKSLSNHLVDDSEASSKVDAAVWIEKDQQAMALIGLCLSDEHLAHVQGLPTAKLMRYI